MASEASEEHVQAPEDKPGLSEALVALAEGLGKGSANSAEEFESLKVKLLAVRVADLRNLAKHVNVRLTGASKKGEIVERLVAMAMIDATRKEGDSETARLTYITDSVHSVLAALPAFGQVSDWKKDLAGLRFHFMDLFTYLVYGRNKSFDMEAMKAFRSLKGYVFFKDGYVKNVWTKNFSGQDKEDEPCIMYVRGYVHHSLSCDPSLVVFVSLNSKTGEVYSGQCNCVAGYVLS